jgi:Flp pilus assembly protein CpaB
MLAMEMEYRDPSRRNRWIIVLGVVFAIVAGAGSYLVLTRAQQTASQPVTAKVITAVVASRALLAHKPLTREDMELRKDIPADTTNAATGLLITNPDELIGVLLAVDVAPGQLITRNLLASDVAGGEFQILAPGESVAPESESWRAVALTVGDDRAVGGMLQAGMHVDVIMTMTVTVPSAAPAPSDRPAKSLPPYFSDATTKITYQDMKILARQGNFYILKATLRVAEEISHMQASGAAQYTFVLRPGLDERIIDLSAFGETTTRIFQRYGLLIPQLIPIDTYPSPPPIPAITPPPTPAPSGSPSASPLPSPSASG